MNRTAIYLRVSTGDQSHAPQRVELVEYCERKGWGEIVEYSDTISGAKFSRIGFDKLMSDVRRRRIARIVVVKLDRLGRSLPHLAQIIAELDANGVALVCTSQAIDTSHGNPAGHLQMHVLMAVAEFERELIRERTKAGLAAARARGERLGRPRLVLTPEQWASIAEYQPRQRGGIRGLARRTGLSVGALATLLKSRTEKPPATAIAIV